MIIIIQAYISHEFIVRLMPTWIWYDLLMKSPAILLLLILSV